MHLNYSVTTLAVIIGIGNLPDWAADTFRVFLGAVLGALLAYAGNWCHHWRQMRAQRAVLFRTLHRQFATIPWTPMGATPEHFMSKRTYHVTAARQLLDSQILDATKDANLIRALILWQASEAQHNDAIHLANQATITPGIASDVLIKAHQYVDDSHNELRQEMLFVQKWLPRDDNIGYAQPDPWPKPWVIKEQEWGELEERERAQRGDS